MPLQQADFRGVAGNDGWPGRDWLRSAAASQPGTVSLRVGSGAAYDDTMKTGPVIDDALHYVKLSDPRSQLDVEDALQAMRGKCVRFQPFSISMILTTSGASGFKD